jgi:hypothetical protein
MTSIKFKVICKFLFLLIPFLLFNSCFQLKYDFKGGVTIRPDIKTFSVQYFDNRARLVEPSFSQRFTDGLRDYIQNNTNLRYVTGLGDIDFSGTIVTYEITPQAIVSGETAAKTRFSIAVKVNYMDTQKPEEDFEKSISGFRDFESTVQFSSVELELSQEIIDEIIEQTYNAAFVNW